MMAIKPSSPSAVTSNNHAIGAALAGVTLALYTPTGPLDLMANRDNCVWPGISGRRSRNGNIVSTASSVVGL